MHQLNTFNQLDVGKESIHEVISIIADLIWSLPKLTGKEET